MNRRTAGDSSRQKRLSLDRRMFLGMVGVAALGTTAAGAAPAGSGWQPSEGPNQPLGEGRGIFPGRVVWMHNPAAVKWDGDPEHGGWFEDKYTDPVLADQMLSGALRLQTGTDSDADAWQAIFRHFNQTQRGRDAGYQPGERVVVKLNLNCSLRQSDPAAGFYNTPQLTRALLRQLVRHAGVAETDIILSDPSRLASEAIVAPCVAEFPQIRFEDRDGAEHCLQARPDKDAAIHFGDPATPHSGETFLPASMAAATYMINASVLKGHSLASVTLCAKNHFGSLFRENANDSLRGWDPSHLHDPITVESRPMATYNPLVDLMGHRHLGGKTILYLIDGLYASMHQNVTLGKWQSAPFNGHWTASLLLSQDPVAIDSVAVDFFAAEETARQMTGSVDNYLHEAALAHAAPSGTRYAPDGSDACLRSLGVHEHWNDPERKQYSRNLGHDRGIELVRGSS